MSGQKLSEFQQQARYPSHLSGSSHLRVDASEQVLSPVGQLSQRSKTLLSACELRRNKKHKQAIMSILNLIHENQSNATAYYLLAQAYLENEQYQLACQAYEKAIQSNPQFEPAYRELAQIYTKRRDYQNAITIYARWLKIDHNRGEIWAKIADILSDKKPEQAAKYYLKALHVGTKQSIHRIQFTMKDEQAMILDDK